jgi:hypothetical protein
MTIQTKSLFVLAQLFVTATGFASNPPRHLASPGGRIVIFSDSQAGYKKTDITLKEGTDQTLNSLDEAALHHEIHTCFRGSAKTIQPILRELITNTNKSNDNQLLKLKSFSAMTGEHESILFEITSGTDETNNLVQTLDPC